MKAGRFSFSEPSPYESQAPMDGRPGLLRAGLDEGDRGVVVDRLGVHRAHEAQLVHDLARCGACSSLTQAPESPCRANSNWEPARGKDFWCAVMPVSRCPIRTEAGQLLAVHGLQQRLVVEEVELGRCPALEEVDHPADARGEVGRGEKRALRRPEGRPRGIGGAEDPGIEERPEGRRPQAQAARGEEVPSRAQGRGVVVVLHRLNTASSKFMTVLATTA